MVQAIEVSGGLYSANEGRTVIEERRSGQDRGSILWLDRISERPGRLVSIPGVIVVRVGDQRSRVGSA